mgnify:CR=1 FL=1
MREAYGILMPAYRPEPVMVEYLKKLRDQWDGLILLIDDGSGPDYREQFQAAERLGAVGAQQLVCALRSKRCRCCPARPAQGGPAVRLWPTVFSVPLRVRASATQSASHLRGNEPGCGPEKCPSCARM